MNAIAADRVWKYFGDYPALRGATFEAAPGACVALLGRNGAGKTTLLRIIANLSKPTGAKSRFSASPPAARRASASAIWATASASMTIFPRLKT